MNTADITNAVAPLIKLAQAELKRELAIERTEAKRKLKYIEAQRDKWKAEALRYRHSLVSRSNQQA